MNFSTKPQWLFPPIANHFQNADRHTRDQGHPKRISNIFRKFVNILTGRNPFNGFTISS
jgi:hypothetical protein